MSTVPTLRGWVCPLLLAVCLLAAFPAAPAQAESAAAAQLRTLAEALAASNASATDEELAAQKSLKENLDKTGPASEATGKAALELGQLALEQGRVGEARSLADAVLGIAATAAGAQQGESTLVTSANALITAAFSVKQAYAGASLAPVAPEQSVLFLDVDRFDRKLSSRLDEKPAKVEVLFASPVQISKLPERLDKWLSAVEDSGGKVETKPLPGRGFLTDLISIIVHAFDVYRASVLYKPAASYNAVVYYEPQAGTLAKVVFTLRSAGQ